MEAVFESFETDVLAASHDVPILVDFWAEWCGPCRYLGPVLEAMEAKAGGKWRLVKINVDEHQAVAQEYRIQGIPACKLFHKGEVIGEFTGALQEPQINAFFDEHLPSEEKALVASARERIAAGDAGGARQILEDVLAGDPANVEAATTLATIVFAENPARAAELVKDVPPGDPSFEAAEAIRTLSEVAAKTEASEDHPGWPGYAAGNAALAEGDYDGALSAWIGVLSAGHRDVDDDGPRKACIALFKFLGEDHPTTQAHRRAFSSALF